MTALKLTGSRCQCCACGEYFGSTDTFDRHRVGRPGVDRRCMSLDEMISAGWAKSARGFWIKHRLEAGRVRAFLRSNSTPTAAPQGFMP